MNCQLAHKYVPGKLEGKEFVITPKLDGVRCIAVKKGGTVRLLSRQGKEIKGFNNIVNDLLFNTMGTFVVDGELLADDGTFKTTSRMVAVHLEHKIGVKFHVFDYVSPNDWINQVSHTPYRERREMIEWFFKGKPNIEVVPALYKGSDESVIETILSDYTRQGGEGLMINVADAPYAFKRTNTLLKVKATKTVSLKVTDYKEGTGKYCGTLGALVVDYKGYPVAVGSGFTDELRNRIYNNIKDYIGKEITVQYFEETNDAQGNLSLRFPVYKRDE